jgi:hypothetical protein
VLDRNEADFSPERQVPMQVSQKPEKRATSSNLDHQKIGVCAQKLRWTRKSAKGPFPATQRIEIIVLFCFEDTVHGEEAMSMSDLDLGDDDFDKFSVTSSLELSDGDVSGLALIDEDLLQSDTENSTDDLLDRIPDSPAFAGLTRAVRQTIRSLRVKHALFSASPLLPVQSPQLDVPRDGLKSVKSSGRLAFSAAVKDTIKVLAKVGSVSKVNNPTAFADALKQVWGFLLVLFMYPCSDLYFVSLICHRRFSCDAEEAPCRHPQHSGCGHPSHPPDPRVLLEAHCFVEQCAV